jgi:peptide/nickel transport system ATP-binding protein
MRLLPWPLVKVTKGEILWQGTKLFDLDEKRLSALRGSQMAIVLQDAGQSLHPTKTIDTQFDELCLYHPQMLSSQEVAERKAQVLRDVGLPDPLAILKMYPHQLSGGMRQRVLVAIALFLEPLLVLADEPTSALDASLQAQLLKILKDYVARGQRSLILISHDIAWLHEACDRILVFDSGHILEEISGRTGFPQARHRKTQELIAAAPFWEKTQSLKIPARSPADVILSAHRLSYRPPVSGFWSKPRPDSFAFHDFNFQLERGEVHGLIGESGSGKSTLARLLAGLWKPAQGEILWQGAPWNSLTRREKARKVQLVLQDASLALHPQRTVLAQLSEVASVVRGKRSPEALKIVKEIMERLGLEAKLAHSYPHELSGGQRQRVNVARALICSPEVLICDEPLSALDRLTQTELLHTLLDWKKERGATLLLIAHDLPLLATWTDRLTVLYGGQCLEEGQSQLIWQNPQHPYTRWLLQSLPRFYRPVYKGESFCQQTPRFPAKVPEACPWLRLCGHADSVCTTQKPVLRSVSHDLSHRSSCHLFKDLPWHNLS